MMNENVKNSKKWLADIEVEINSKTLANQESLNKKLTQIPKTILKSQAKERPEEVIANFKVKAKTIEVVNVTVENPEYKSTSDRLKEVELVASKTITFRTALEAMGLKPIAIIPTKAWARICKETDLFRFEQFHGKKVGANIENITSGISGICIFCVMAVCFVAPIILSAIFSHATLSQIMFLVALTIFEVMFYVSSIVAEDKGKLKLSTFLTVVFFGTYFVSALIFAIAWNLGGWQWASLISFVVMTVTCVSITSKSFEKFLLEVVVRTISMKRMVRALWPDNIDIKIDNADYTNSVTPIFPEPDEQFVETLISLRNNQEKLCVAAEVNAVRVDRHQILRKAARLAEYFHTKDPILYIYNAEKDVVAIMGQFGSFSKEKEAVELVKKASFDELI